MIYPSILDRKYNEYKPFIEAVAKKVKETLLNFCDNQGYAFTSRIKNVESLAEKIETGRFQKWSDLDDLFACTIIIPTLSHEQEVIDFCKSTFEIIRTVKRGQNKKSPDTFRFDSTRIYARLRKNDDTDSILSTHKIIFEIQIKSAFEHAWSVSTHDLVYKNAEVDWKRLRLAAQLKATVEQLDTLILAFEKTSEFIQENDYPEIKIKRYLATETNKLFESRKIPDELKPKDMSRFCNNLYFLMKQVNQERNMKNIINQVTTKIRATKSNQIPRSISLFQYFVAILVSERIISTSTEQYSWHITQEVVTLYPTLKEIRAIFEYNEIS
jgi:ppGpp synthetase/RelA/SpoT-type nucleotidyltranferase